MFGPLGFPEMLFILVLALLIFGPKRLPEVGRTIGKGMAQFRKATADLKRTIETEISLEEEPPRRPVRPVPRPEPRPLELASANLPDPAREPAVAEAPAPIVSSVPATSFPASPVPASSAPAPGSPAGEGVAALPAAPGGASENRPI